MEIPPVYTPALVWWIGHAIAQANSRRVLAAFQKHRVAEAYFAGTTGYGYAMSGWQITE